MPEFDEVKPVDSKTDYELKSKNHPKKSEPEKPVKQSQSGFDKPAAPKRARRSRYHRVYRKPRSGPIKRPSPPITPEPAAGSEDSQKPVRSRPPRRKGPRPHAKADQDKRPPRHRQKRNGNRGRPGGPRKRGNKRPADHRSGRRQPSRKPGRHGGPRKRGNKRPADHRSGRRRPSRKPGRHGGPRHRKPPAPKGLVASILTRIKSLLGIKEPEPVKPKRKHYPKRRRGKNYRPNKAKGNRPKRPTPKGDGSKQTSGRDTRPKYRRPRRRRRRRGGPRHGQKRPHAQKDLTGDKARSKPSPPAASPKNPPPS